MADQPETLSRRTDSPTRLTVLLRHDLPDGSNHIDWLLAPEVDGERPLVAFRTSQRVDHAPAGRTFALERIADHRPLYLEYEGPISGNRGSVMRLQRGEIVRWDRTAEDGVETWILAIKWGEAEESTLQHLRVICRNLRDWSFFCFHSASPSGTMENENVAPRRFSRP